MWEHGQCEHDRGPAVRLTDLVPRFSQPRCLARPPGDGTAAAELRGRKVLEEGRGCSWKASVAFLHDRVFCLVRQRITEGPIYPPMIPLFVCGTYRWLAIRRTRSELCTVLVLHARREVPGCKCDTRGDVYAVFLCQNGRTCCRLLGPFFAHGSYRLSSLYNFGSHELRADCLQP